MNKKQIVLLIGVLFLGVFLHQAMAASNPVSGYAWSENIGWIHFNPPLGGVFLDDVTGNFSGYAWSENIGWVDFGPTSGYPAAPNYGAKMDLATGFITGWAKAVAGGSSGSGGWDGWINMNGSSPNYGVISNLITGDFSGWAWASDVVGWISFSGDTAGAGGGDYKVTMNPIAPPSAVPDDPSGLTAVAGTGAACETVDLAWTDNADNETSCKVERKTTGVFSEITSLPADTENYTDSGLVGGTEYTYRVRACNANGCSGYSNEANATAVACAALPFFSLNNSNVLYITLVGTGSATSNSTTITISPQGGFDEDVSLSSDVSSVISGAIGSFSDSTLIESEYVSGSTFNITVPAGTANGLYTITVTGTSQSFTGTIDVNLNIESLNPKWREI